MSHHGLYEIVGGAGRRAQAQGPGALQPLRPYVGDRLDAVRVAGKLGRQLQQPHAVGARLARDDEEHVGARRYRPDGVLPVLGGETEVVGGWHEEFGEPLLQEPDGAHGVVYREGRLGQHHDLLRVGNRDRPRVGELGVVFPVAEHRHDRGLLRGLAESADHLLVARGVADQQDMETLRRVLLGLVVNLRHERTGGVYRREPQLGRPLPDHGAHAVSAEDDRGADLAAHRGGLRAGRLEVAQALDEGHAVLVLEALDHRLVVHYVVVNGDVTLAPGSSLGGRFLDRVDRHDHAGAEAARFGKVEAFDAHGGIVPAAWVPGSNLGTQGRFPPSGVGASAEHVPCRLMVGCAPLWPVISSASLGRGLLGLRTTGTSARGRLAQLVRARR